MILLILFLLLQTQVSTLICDSKQLKRLHAISSSLESIKNVLYFEDEPQDSNVMDNMNKWRVLSFNEVEKLGKENRAHPTLPSSTDVAFIMYTSGSTGVPKVSSFSALYILIVVMGFIYLFIIVGG